MLNTLTVLNMARGEYVGIVEYVGSVACVGNVVYVGSVKYIISVEYFGSLYTFTVHESVEYMKCVIQKQFFTHWQSYTHNITKYTRSIEHLFLLALQTLYAYLSLTLLHQ